MPLETLKAFLKGTTPKKDTKSIYVVDLWNFGQFFPDVLVTHSAEWTGKICSFSIARKKCTVTAK